MKRVHSNTRTSKGTSSRDAAVWGAVALQQHISRQFKLIPQMMPSSSVVMSDALLPQHPPPLTLAQRMGLAERPPPAPTEEQWQTAELQSHLREDCVRPCAICHLTVGLSSMTILSCSHSFHTECIRRFEEFVRRSRGDLPRSCPVCRKEHYYARRFEKGEEAFRIRCITKVQSIWRGIKARKEYVRLRRKHDPKFAADWYYNKLKGMADRYVVLAEARSIEVDNFLEALDRERNLALLKMLGTSDWMAIRTQFLQRCCGVGDDDGGGGGVDPCPICMQPVVCPSTVALCNGRPAELLSCSHCFHLDCIGVYEVYLKDPSNPKCPVCRAMYVRQPLFLVAQPKEGGSETNTPEELTTMRTVSSVPSLPPLSVGTRRQQNSGGASSAKTNTASALSTSKKQQHPGSGSGAKTRTQSVDVKKKSH
eukprot:PhF_6_TR8468/c0_g1_i1/m.13230